MPKNRHENAKQPLGAHTRPKKTSILRQTASKPLRIMRPVRYPG
jgi:hypothetical protein